MYIVQGEDPNHFNVGWVQAFHFHAHQDPAFHFNYADPAPFQRGENLRPLVYRPSRAPF
jgi:hypothetical protein